MKIPFCLILDSLHDRRRSVAEASDADAGEQIEILLAVFFRDDTTTGSFDLDAQRVRGGLTHEAEEVVTQHAHRNRHLHGYSGAARVYQRSSTNAVLR